MLLVGRSSPAALSAKPAISLDGEKSVQAAIPIEVRNDLSVARLIAACDGKAARDGRPTRMRVLLSRAIIGGVWLFG